MTAAPYRRAMGKILAGRPGLAVLQVDGVDDRSAANALQRRLDHRRLRGVDHQRHRTLGGQSSDEVVHVRHPVAPHVVHADVQDVRPFLRLVPGHRHHAVRVASQQAVAELLRPVGIRALAHDQEALLLTEWHAHVQAGGRGNVLRHSGERGALADDIHHTLQVGRRRAAAAPDDVYAMLFHEVPVVLGQLVRSQKVPRPTALQVWQAGVRKAREGLPAGAAEEMHVLHHLLGPGGAVQSDHVQVVGVQGGQRRGDLRPQEHGPGGLHRDLHHEREPPTRRGHGVAAPDDGCLGLEKILTGLDQEDIGAAVHQPPRLLGAHGHQIVKADLSQGWQTRSGADGSHDEAGMVRRGESRRHLVGQASRRVIDLVRLLRQAVLTQDEPAGSEGVGLDGVAAHLQEAGVDLSDDLRARQDQELVAALLPFKIVRGEVAILNGGPHGTIEDQDALAKLLSKVRCHGHPGFIPNGAVERRAHRARRATPLSPGVQRHPLAPGSLCGLCALCGETVGFMSA